MLLEISQTVIQGVCRGIYPQGMQFLLTLAFVTCFHNQIDFSALIKRSQLLCHNSMSLATLRPWTSDLTSLSLSFLTNKYGNKNSTYFIERCGLIEKTSVNTEELSSGRTKR